LGGAQKRSPMIRLLYWINHKITQYLWRHEQKRRQSRHKK